MYVIEPKETIKVEGNMKHAGLKVAIIYDASPDGNVLMYHRWQCRNKSVISIAAMKGQVISLKSGKPN
jgi:hypothetical protein